MAIGGLFQHLSGEIICQDLKNGSQLLRVDLKGLGRHMHVHFPEDVVGACIFLASAESDFITGPIFYRSMVALQ